MAGGPLSRAVARRVRSAARGGALALLLFASGCERREAGTRLVVWGLGREGEVLRELVPAFEQAHPGVTVEVQQIPWTAAHEKLLTSFVGRSSPDVAQLGNTWIPEFHAIGALLPLDARVAASASVHRDDYFAGIWDTNVIDAETWGVPWYVDTRVLFYRTDLLRDAGYAEMPRHWGEWKTALRAMRSRFGANQWPILLPSDEWVQPVILGIQAGSPLLADGGRRGAFAAPEFAGATEFYLDFFRGGLAPRMGINEIANLYQQFADGTFAMTVSGPWNLGEFRRRLPELAGRWSTAPMPAPDGAPWPGASLAGGASLAIFESTSHPELAWQLVEFLSTREALLELYALSGDLPPRRSVWEAPELAGNREAQAFRVQLGNVVSTPKLPEWERIATALYERLEPAIRGSAPGDAVLRRLDSQVDDMLVKRRWLLDRDAAAAGGSH